MSNFSRSQPGLVCWLLSLCLWLFQPSGANAGAASAKGGSVRISAEATRVNQAPKLDGTLNDLLWQSANPITDFRQREPHEGEAPSEETEVRILYTRHAVYFGIHCFDSEPSRIIATELRRDVSQDSRAEFNNGAYTDNDIADVFTQLITTPFHIYKSVFIPNGIYHFARHQLTYGSGQDRRFTYNFFERFGGYYGGTLNEFRVRANYRPTVKFSISASETWNRFRLPLPNGNFSVVLASLQANYSFSRFLTFTSLLQMDTSNTQAVSANLRLRYNYRPDSDLYIIYNVETQFASIAPANPPQVRETRFAVKYTYSFAP